MATTAAADYRLRRFLLIEQCPPRCPGAGPMVDTANVSPDITTVRLPGVPAQNLAVV
jgi:hypothetical protein